MVRLSREYLRRGKRVGVLILMDKISTDLKKQLDQVADVYLLKDFINYPFKWAARSQLGIFCPVNINKLSAIIHFYGPHVHVMGVFGLLFATQYIKKSNAEIKLTAGIYQQYEFMFNSKSFLAQFSQKLFKNLGSKNTIFFNEATIKSHSKFFGTDYSHAPLVPVGIELPQKNSIKGGVQSYKIVSIGNLYRFKTYNLHIVNLMPELLKINKSFTYEIYGEGELEQEIKILIQRLGLEKKVFLKGRIPYSQFSEVLDGAFVFVGSGTAIVEASALGIPSVIGIESSLEPVTYGYLSDVQGFSYNEFNEFQKTILMFDVIEAITLDRDYWNKASRDCKNKASQFSIVHTVDGFEEVLDSACYFDAVSMESVSNIKLLSSFIFLGLIDYLKIDSTFSNRRNGL